jgi:hypothetical protein
LQCDSARPFGEWNEFRNVWPGHDEYAVDIRAIQRGDDVFDNGAIAKRKAQLGPAHARAATGGR